MRVFLAGATGVIGRGLVARLQTEGRTVVAAARTPAAASALEQRGCEAVVVDALDASALKRAAVEARPEIIINQLTKLPKDLTDLKASIQAGKDTNQLRALGGPALAEAAQDTGAQLIAQSIAFAQKPGSGIRKEEDPLYVNADGGHKLVVQAIALLEQATIDAGGVVLRYGAFYGPGTYFAPDGAYSEMLRRRLLPIVGAGRGSFNLLHVDDAIDATIRAIVAPSGIYNIVDDERVTAGDLFRFMAEKLGAPPPRRVPAFAFGLGPLAVLRYLIDEQPAVSNSKAKEILQWHPAHPGWKVPLAELLAS